ncbi:MAG: hypothetical protein MI919_29280 [Holophagales bacterium]|nr:hypothetical protein [Holophagales bacterium]
MARSGGARSAAEARRWRPAVPRLDPWKLIGRAREEELEPDGRLRPSTTLFLAGAECPFTCNFCDLWRHTIEGPTPPGALPAQIRDGLAGLPAAGRGEEILKLYNASNFFDARSVPEADDGEIATLADGYGRVVVECHPHLLGAREADGWRLRDRVHRFADALGGRLEVAMGFETVHPEALASSRKGVGTADLARAARHLLRAGIDVRAFVLVGAPFVPLHEELPWLERTVRFALESGARLVSLIPVRGGEGEMARLEAAGELEPPGLTRVEAAWEHCRAIEPRAVRLDTWDLENLPTDSGGPQDPASGRLERLRRAQTHPDWASRELVSHER